MNKYQYDVALSFAGEDRDTARDLANLLIDRGVRVFYDEFETANLWGKNLVEHFLWLYSEGAKYFVPIVSEHYLKKAWPRAENRSAQSRQLEEDAEYVLPIQIDDSKLPGLPSTISSVSVQQYELAQIADMILIKLGVPGPANLSTDPSQSGPQPPDSTKLLVRQAPLSDDLRVVRHMGLSSLMFGDISKWGFFRMISLAASGTEIEQQRLDETFLDTSRVYSEALYFAGPPRIHSKGYTREYRQHTGMKRVTEEATSCYLDGLVVTEGDLSQGDGDNSLNPTWLTYKIQRHLQLSAEVLQGATNSISFLLQFENMENMKWEVYRRRRVLELRPYAGYHSDINRVIDLSEIHGSDKWNEAMSVVKDMIVDTARMFGFDKLPNSYWDGEDQLVYSKGVPNR